ncbi:aspartate/glutamate racemase family protein [Halocola ammonii]
MKTLGMIGGTSWHATIEYYRFINEGVAREIGTQGNPPLIIHSINIEVMRSQDKDRIVSTYTDVAKKLEAAGAEAIVICANTPHLVYKEVQPQITIPFLHIARATGKEAQKLGLKKLGILGNKPTMTGNFIHNIIENEFEIDLITPQGESLDRSHHFVSKELTQGEFTKEARQFYKREIENLQSRGADGIVLGCTELPILLKDQQSEIPLLSTTHLHAQMAVDFILGH